MSYLDEFAEKQLPLFVYGTLRPGQENYVVLRGHTAAEHRASVEGLCLYSFHTYPLAIPGDRVVVGELVTLNPNIYHELLTGLDKLEGCDRGIENSLFRRVACQAQTETRSGIFAWMYLGNPHYLDEQHHLLIAHGDWVRYRHERILRARVGRFVIDASIRAKGPE